MARQIPELSPPPNVDTINLTRLISRLNDVILSDNLDTKILRSSTHRARIHANLEYARTLLLRFEHSSANVQIQSRKQSAQSDLVKKREQIKRLNEALNSYSQLDEDAISDDDEGEDLLGEDDGMTLNGGPEGSIATHQNAGGSSSATTTPTLDRRKPASGDIPTADDTNPNSHSNNNILRSRRPLNSQLPTTTPTSTASGALFSKSSNSQEPTKTTQESLAAHSEEQESLTASLVDVARQLKQSTLKFSQTVELDKSTVDRATEGLDRNTAGMEAAGRKMGVLRKMSEGRGWWGRMMLYAWIFGLMVAAVLIVFVGPKLRF